MQRILAAGHTPATILDAARSTFKQALEAIRDTPRDTVGPAFFGPRRRSTASTSPMPSARRAYIAGRSQAPGRAPTSDDYLFTAPEGGPLRRDLLHKRCFRPAVLKAGLPEGLRVHDLRHTCASILIDLGAHPKFIQERSDIPQSWSRWTSTASSSRPSTTP